ncbi:SAM-dependent methyltransferase [Campylobacterota bacterium]|nr:SAM-dependent methyltransferase [Campylobacterota bacterium]
MQNALIFRDYVQKWLYHIEGGYYANAPAIGMRGDFYTSVTLSPFFGGAIANEIISLVERGAIEQNAAIVEFGSHNARLIADVAQFIYTLRPELAFSLKFAIVEPIAALQKIQKDYLLKSFAEKIDFCVTDALENVQSKSAFVFANELFDSFPFDLIYGDRTAFVENNKIIWLSGDPKIIKRARELNIEQGELFYGYEDFAQKLKAVFENLFFMTFDYGQSLPRHDFSARIYERHKTIPLFEIDDLSPYFQKCDLTADAAFWHIEKAFKDAGFSNTKTINQNSALIDMGLIKLLEIYQEKAGFEAYKKEAGRIKMLLDPAHLGERFKRFTAS